MMSQKQWSRRTQSGVCYERASKDPWLAGLDPLGEGGAPGPARLQGSIWGWGGGARAPVPPWRLPGRAVTATRVKRRPLPLRGRGGPVLAPGGGESAGNGLLALTHPPQACHSFPRLPPRTPPQIASGWSRPLGAVISDQIWPFSHPACIYFPSALWLGMMPGVGKKATVRTEHSMPPDVWVSCGPGETRQMKRALSIWKVVLPSSSPASTPSLSTMSGSRFWPDFLKFEKMQTPPAGLAL